MQLTDVLQAQSESRAQHEQFHNLLNRSNDPFSVVAEYFAHGMFNKILIVDEKYEDIVQEVNIASMIRFFYYSYSTNKRESIIADIEN